MSPFTIAGECVVCGTPKHLDGRYDRGWCPKCDIWLEPQCSCTPQDKCHFKISPDKPSDDPDIKHFMETEDYSKRRR